MSYYGGQILVVYPEVTSEMLSVSSFNNPIGLYGFGPQHVIVLD